MRHRETKHRDADIVIRTELGNRLGRSWSGRSNGTVCVCDHQFVYSSSLM